MLDGAMLVGQAHRWIQKQYKRSIRQRPHHMAAGQAHIGPCSSAQFYLADVFLLLSNFMDMPTGHNEIQLVSGLLG